MNTGYYWVKRKCDPNLLQPAPEVAFYSDDVFWFTGDERPLTLDHVTVLKGPLVFDLKEH